MLRTSTSYLLIAIVLTCPYLCLGGPAAEANTACQACGCCCAKHHDQSRSEAPKPTRQDASDCLCRGAIMGVVRPAEFNLSTSPAIVRLTSDAMHGSVALFLADASSDPPHSFPPFSSGWDVRVLTCALLL